MKMRCGSILVFLSTEVNLCMHCVHLHFPETSRRFSSSIVLAAFPPIQPGRQKIQAPVPV